MRTETLRDNAFITREHPDYVLNRQNRGMYQDLYAGGERFKTNASRYLVRRNREPNDIFFERLNRVFYENYVGSIIDWYAATLFRREPAILFDGASESSRNFFNNFSQDCDRRGTTITEFYRRQITQSLIFGRSYIAIDFPQASGPVFSRAQEDQAGLSRAYLAEYTAEEVINWSYTSEETLDWIVIRTGGFKQPSVRDERRKGTRWLYYDRTGFELYESEGDASPELIAAGRHALAKQKRVPVFEVRVSNGLWLMNKASLLQLEHFNKSNALSWALTMGLFATPVVYSDREFSQIVGESYFIQLGAQDRFGWTEPEGHVFQIAADNLERLKDEIYRVCYLTNQISGRLERAAQSGLSKAWDFSVTEEILRVYGDIAKDSMRMVLNAVSEARQDGVKIDVSGLDEFDIQDFTNELKDAQNVLALNIPSETLKRQLFKRIALKYFSDARQDLKTKITCEIDESLAHQSAGGEIQDE